MPRLPLITALLLAACAHPQKATVVVDTVPALPQDVATIDGVMRAFYEVLNVAPDGPRQWARDRTLYAPWIRFVAIGGDGDLHVWDHQQFVEATEPLIRAGFREQEIFRRVRRYGDMVHVDSTYETLTGPDLGTRSRGVNSLELYHDGTRWWIASVVWQSETPEHPIPPELLPASSVRQIPITTPKGTFQVWTKRIGDNPRIKVLLLHGGPGDTHTYFEALESSLLGADVEFYYYDQLGSGFSDHPDDATLPALLDVDRFVDEVEQVRSALGLGPDDFYLFGHSWGGILAIEYALKHQQNLKGLIISNMMASIPAYNAYAEKVLIPAMDPKVVAEIRALEAAKDFENPRYEALLEGYYLEHVLRIPRAEWPDPVVRSFAQLNKTIYLQMQGPSELGASGLLRNWDRTRELAQITVPTLVVGARHDTMDPSHMEWMSKQLPNGRYLYCANGSHLALYDDQATYMAGLVSFLLDVDRGGRAQP